MEPRKPRWITWVKNGASHPIFPIIAALIVTADFFFPLLPSTALVVFASLVAPRKWWSIAVGCSVGSALGCLIIATLFQEFGWMVINYLFGDLRAAPQWQTIEWAIQKFGIFALFLMSFLPMPLRVPTLITAVGGIPAYGIALTVLFGRLLGYGALAGLAAKSPDRLLRLPLIGKSKTIRALLQDEKAFPAE
jgi:hypothetical protein